MEKQGRLKNSARNLMYGFMAQIIVLLLNFVVRAVFIRCLDSVYLGVNGLFTNILTVLSLAEMGFGTAMVYSMYKPLAEDDTEKLSALMQLYRKVYTVIGIVVALLGISIIPFMDYIIKDKPDIEYLTFIYLMYLSNTVVSYLFFAYKRSILNADQKAYLVSKYRYIFAIVKTSVQIVVLIVFRNFIMYLLIQILCTIIENIAISRTVNKRYPFLVKAVKIKLEKSELQRIKEDVKALILSNIARVALNGTDNIIISSMVGVLWVGKLSNYTLITGSLVMVLSQISTAITGSVGNFVASEKRDRQYLLFKKIDFLNFWFYGFSMIALAVLANPFISIVFDKKLILSQTVVCVIAINFLVEGMLQSLWTFRTTMGLFTQGKYRPLFAATLNIVVSIVLAKYIGILGVLLGTTISRVFVNAWYDPYIIFKHGLQVSVRGYYMEYLKRIVIVGVTLISLLGLRNIIFINGVNIIKFIAMMGITAIVPNVVFLAIYYKSEEFQYFKEMLMKSVNGIIMRGRS